MSSGTLSWPAGCKSMTSSRVAAEFACARPTYRQKKDAAGSFRSASESTTWRVRSDACVDAGAVEPLQPAHRLHQNGQRFRGRCRARPSNDRYFPIKFIADPLRGLGGLGAPLGERLPVPASAIAAAETHGICCVIAFIEVDVRSPHSEFEIFEVG